MDIIGTGFLARNLRPLGSRHRGVVALAAGVPSTVVTDDGAFTREAELLYRTIADCRRRGRLLVFFSTCSAAMYGAQDDACREDGPVYPPIAYGRHNLALEAVVAAAGIDALVLRLTHLIGPHQRPHQMFARMVRQVREGRVDVYRDSHRDLLDVDDLVVVLDRLLTDGVIGEVVNVASGVLTRVEDVTTHIERRLGVTAERRYVETAGGTIEQPVSTAKLRRLVPEVAGMGFDDGYYRAVTDRHLPWYAGAAAGAGRLRA